MAGEKILPFDVVLTSLGREIDINATWNYVLFPLKTFRAPSVLIIINNSIVGNFIADYSDGEQFDEGSTIPAFPDIRTFSSGVFASEFSGDVYLLSKVNFEDFTFLSLPISYFDLNFSELSNFPLESIALISSNNISGDLSLLPSTIKHYNDKGNSEIKSYNGFNFQDGMSQFVLYPIFSYALTIAQIDQLLIDLSNAVWDPVGGLFIDLKGFNQVPSATGDAAILDLQAQGVVVNVNSAYNNFTYYMYNNQFDNLNTANRFDFLIANSNYLDLTVATSGTPIVLAGSWFVEWVQDNVTTDPVLFGSVDDFYQIKLVGGASAIVSISANSGGHTPVTFSYTCLVNKIYRLQSDGQGRFFLYENGVEVDDIVVGSNQADLFICHFVGAYKIGPAFIPSEPKISYCGFGQSNMLLHKYLFQEGSGLNIYDSIGGFHGLMNGTETWVLGVNTPIAAGNQSALNSWNNVAGVLIAEDESDPGNDVLGNPILRPSFEDGYNFSGLLGNNFRFAGVMDRTGAGTDLFLFTVEDLAVQSYVSGDEIFKLSVQTNGKILVEFNGGAMESAAVIPTSKMFLVAFITDGVTRGQIYLGDSDNFIALDNEDTVGPAAVAAQPIQYGSAAGETDNLDGYVGHAANFPRELDLNELGQIWYYYRKFFIN